MKSKTVKILAVTFATVLLVVIIGLIVTQNSKPDDLASTVKAEALFSIDAAEVRCISFENWFDATGISVFDEDQIAEIIEVFNGFRYTEKIEEPQVTEPAMVNGRFNLLSIYMAEEEYTINCWASSIEYLGSRYIAAEEGYFSDFIEEWFPDIEIDPTDEPLIVYRDC